MMGRYYTLLILVWTCQAAWAQGGQELVFSDSLAKLYPFTFFQTEATLDLETGWRSGNQERSLPFVLGKGESGEWEKHFSLPCQPVDSLFLFLEGVSWRAEAELNGYFLGVHEDPFSPWTIALAPHWLREDDNELIIRMGTGQRYDLYPQQFLGIFRPAFLLDRSQLQRISRSPLPLAAGADTLGVLAPFYRGSSYVFDSLEAARNVLPLLQEGIRHVAFPFRPSRRLQALCAQLGLVEVPLPQQEGLICWVNAYNFEARSLQYIPQFWLDSQARPTRHYGCYYRWKASGDPPTIPSGLRIWLAVLIFLPLPALAMVKLLSPGWLAAMRPVLLRPKLHMDSLYDITFSNPGLLYILVFFRILLWAGFLTLVFFYLQRANQWNMLNIFKDWSLLNYLFYGEYSLVQLFVRSLLLVLGLFFLEQSVNWLVSVIFRIKGFAMGMLNLNTIGAYPLVWALSLPMAFILFVDDPGRQLFVPVMAVLLLFYVLRRVYLGYVGLEKIFSFSTGIKILYICAFNILPYIIWF